MVPIDWQKVADMCAAGAHSTSIAHQFGINADTLCKRMAKELGTDFTSFRATHFERGNDILRVKQFEVAAKGDKSLLVWLGKQRLGQRDKQDINAQVNYQPPVINITVQAPRNDGDDPDPAPGSGGG